MARPGRLLVAAASAAFAFAFAFGGCGGDDPAEPAAGASGEQGSPDITAAEFLPKLLPEKEVALEAIVATEPACEGVKVQPSFVLVVSDDASKADPDTPLTDLVEPHC